MAHAFRSFALAGLFAAALSGLASAQAKPQGYLSPERTAAISALVTPPPAAGSARAAADLDAYARTRALEGSARWLIAQDQADLGPADGGRLFDCAIGARLGQNQPPALTRLLTRMITDVGVAYRPAKERFKRPRPLMDNDLHVCVAREDSLKNSWSYPSGHAAIGWAWALALAEIEPDRADAILKTGLSLGDNRVVCGYHYPSDIEAGRMVGAAVLAAEHASPDFVADLAAARAEIDALRARGETNPRCAAEADAMSSPAY